MAKAASLTHPQAGLSLESDEVVPMQAVLETTSAFGLAIAPEAALFATYEFVTLCEQQGALDAVGREVGIDPQGRLLSLATLDGSGARPRPRAHSETYVREQAIGLLAALLVRATPPYAPYIVQLADAKQAPQSLADFKEALLDAMLPLNESAARRVLARFRRRALSFEAEPLAIPDVSGLEQASLDQELDRLLERPELIRRSLAAGTPASVSDRPTPPRSSGFVERQTRTFATPVSTSGQFGAWLRVALTATLLGATVALLVYVWRR